MNKEIEDFQTVIRYLYPTRIMKSEGSVIDCNKLLEKSDFLSVTFDRQKITRLENSGGERAVVVLDFSKELSGGIRIISGQCSKNAKVRVVFGESVNEALSEIGEKGSMNDHSLRDVEVFVPSMSDFTYGQTGFRFVKIELLTDGFIDIRNVVAVSRMQNLERVGKIVTDDERLNQIIETAVYTCELNMQNGVMWDGIKRDRLIWAGDLNQGLLSAQYTFRDFPNIKNSLNYLIASTDENEWINDMPTYSAWYVINLCDYCRLSGETEFFKSNHGNVMNIVRRFDEGIGETEINLAKNSDRIIYHPLFLDWQTVGTPDCEIGSAMLFLMMTHKLLPFLTSEEDRNVCFNIQRKLKRYTEKPTLKKQTRAVQVLCDGNLAGAKEFLERDGANGFSTFMSYFILKALKKSGSNKSVALLKEYYGAMLDRGATSFFEDFELSWLDGSGRIDEITPSGLKDLHGDYGAFCYKGFRHSLCHTWSSGIVAFIVEDIIGLRTTDGFKTYTVEPDTSEVKNLQATIPTPYGAIDIRIKDGKLVSAERI